MTTTQYIGSANVMTELYFESLRRLDLLDKLHAVPFAIQARQTGFSSAARCLAFLASQAQRCRNLTDWTGSMRQDSRLQHWLGGRTGPHPSTLSRTLAAADEETVKALREVLVPLGNQAVLRASSAHLFVDIDSKGMPAEGKTYEGTATGRMGDGTFARGYRLHLRSLDNRWPLEMRLTRAQAHGAAEAMVMVKSLMRRFRGRRRQRLVIAANLTQWIREQAQQDDLPIPAGLSETLVAAADSGLRLVQAPRAGCTLAKSHTTRYTQTFEKALQCCRQLCFLFAA